MTTSSTRGPTGRSSVHARGSCCNTRCARRGALFIQAIRQRLRVPEVVTLTEYDRLPNASVAFSRRNVFKRDHYTCQYCGVQPGAEELSIDHVIPRSQGGASTWENCVLS